MRDPPSEGKELGGDLKRSGNQKRAHTSKKVLASCLSALCDSTRLDLEGLFQLR